jgi:AcrR family transcriptional regulator
MQATVDIAEQSTVAPEARAMRSDARRNRDKVIKAARKSMARDGLDAQMDEIARAAGLGVGTVYRHFPNKDELVAALAQERFERLAELAHEALADPDPWQSFEDFIRASARIQTEDRALSEVLVSRPEVMGPASERVGMLDLVGKLMTRAQEAGVMRPDAEPRDVPMLMCALAGTHRIPKMDPERYITIALDGLRGPGHSALPGR